MTGNAVQEKQQAAKQRMEEEVRDALGRRPLNVSSQFACELRFDLNTYLARSFSQGFIHEQEWMPWRLLYYVKRLEIVFDEHYSIGISVWHIGLSVKF